MNIVIIAYREDHTDYCRGCAVGSTASDMQYGVFDDIEAASDFLATYVTKNEVRDPYGFAAYEFSYVINGVHADDVDADDHMLIIELEAQARVKANIAVIEYNNAEEERKAKVEADRIERERQQELATIARLQEKHKTQQV